MKYLNKISISPLCVLLVLFGMIFNRLDDIFSLFLICFIHEMGHIFMAKCFLCKINKVSVNVFGFSAELEGADYLSCWKQILIFIAGPMTFFVSWLIIFVLGVKGIINHYQYEVYMNNNISLCLFNLIPLYPLDGGRILDRINMCYFPVKYCFKVRRFWSFICSVVLCYVLLSDKQFVLFVVLMSFVLFNAIFFKCEYVSYLENRLDYKICFCKKVSFDGDVYHFSNNYYFKGKNLVNEKEMIPVFILRENYSSYKCGKKYI